MPSVKISRKFLLILSLIYVYLPISIFLVGWTKPYIAMACLCVLFICAVRCRRQAKADRMQRDNEPDERLRVSVGTLELALFFFVFIGYYAGYGRFVDQTADWDKHNAVLADLVNRPWPVYYSNGEEHSMLTYYIAQYIVPGVVGKVFHSFRCAELSLYAWNVAGIFLVFLHLISFLKAGKLLPQLACAAAIPFFSIPVWFSIAAIRFITGKVVVFGHDADAVNWFYLSENWHSDGITLQYFDNFFHLKWTFPQVITIWLLVMLLLEYREYIRYYVIILLPGLLFASLSFLGLLPLALGLVIGKLVRERGRNLISQIFSFENISVALTVGLVFLLYFYGNVTGEKPAKVNFRLLDYTQSTIAGYLTFVMPVLIYAVVLFKDYRKDSIYYAVFGTLLLLPFCRMGLWNDLLTRASIPALFILMVYALLFLKRQYESADFLNSKKAAVCLVFLLVGAYYPFSQLSSGFAFEDYHKPGHAPNWPSMEIFANRKLKQNDDVKYNYYSYDLENNIFYKYIAPRN